MVAFYCSKHGGGVAAFTSPYICELATCARLDILKVVQIILHLDPESMAIVYVDFNFYTENVCAYEDRAGNYQIKNNLWALEIFDKLVPCCKICLEEFFHSTGII